MRSALFTRLAHGVAGLPPGYFALVMATGIISTDARALSLPALSWALFGVAALAWAVLAALTAVRLTAFRERVERDLADPEAAFGFFTFVAGTNVLAARLGLAGRLQLVLMLGAIALVGFALIVTQVARMAFRLPLRRYARVARGNWLIAVVALQSLAIVAVALSTRWAPAPLLFGALVAWLAGLLLYALMIGFVAARLMGASSDPRVFTPDFWITMGALAISTLAATRLLGATDRLQLIADLRGQIKELTWAIWVLGTGWIPVVLACEWSKWRRVPGALRYVPYRWSTVFPLGMYTAATLGMHAALGLPAFEALGDALFWIALSVWLLTMMGLLRSLLRRRVPAESLPAPRSPSPTVSRT